MTNIIGLPERMLYIRNIRRKKHEDDETKLRVVHKYQRELLQEGMHSESSSEECTTSSLGTGLTNRNSLQTGGEWAVANYWGSR